ncbi:hypothetical protein BDK92_2774 [Micromonospora pisi]|uniref:Uncharacterized protein n=1 Tax=Micromonospora pisi TaxID=589240 RepID=A0A495JHH2_9ACTN|nr:hypothetical protein [Micromonospora pisi]RKR88446.1 hypothetical protein BDK92_2774 [Micromonospora pisi]
MNPIEVYAGTLPVPNVYPNTVSRNPVGVEEMYLIHEALSRARMRLPQAGRNTTRTEATRSARVIALEARRRAARDLGSF